jgi:hypothetical protein
MRTINLVPVAETVLSFPRKRESITDVAKGSFESIDPRLRGGDSLSATDNILE